jgi:tetratricopeptide (TPR) repeat protein
LPKSVNLIQVAQEGVSILNKGPVRLRTLALGVTLLVLTGSANASNHVDTNPMNHDPEVREAFHYFYNLDFPEAVGRFDRFHAEHPTDPQATTYLLEAELFQELYRQDLLDTTFYANDGFLTGRHATREDPQARDRILGLADEAVREADYRISKNPNDVDALFARGWARALKCTYLAMVQRDFSGGFHLANKARDDEDRVLRLDPNYVDAKLVAGIYQYVVGALPWPFKFLIGFAGITGSKSTGLAMLKDASEQGVITSMEARTAMALFLRRESKYQEAIKVVESLETQYPHDFLFRLEEANLRRDAGEGMVAVEAYHRLLADAARPGYFPSAQMELAWFGFGDALRGQHHFEEAAQAFEKAASAHDVGPELKIRTLLAAGECHDILGERQKAIADYQAAINTGPNTSRADTARKHLRTPYKEN